jgi:hypothetical protein
MAITVIRPSDIGSSVSQDIGKGIGTGLNSLLDQYSQNKMRSLLERQQQQQQQQHQQQQRELLEQSGFPSELATLVSHGQFSPEQIKALQILSAGRGSEQTGSPEGQPQITLQDVLGNHQPSNAIERAIGKTPVGQQPLQQSMPKKQTAYDLFSNYETPQMKQQRELAEKKSEETGIRHSEKLHHKELSDIRRRGKVAREQRRDVALLRQLNDSGKLFQGVPRALLEKYDAQDLITNPETEVGAKLIERIALQGASSIPTGGRLTDSYRAAVQKSYGRLINSQEGLRELLNIADDSAAMEEAHTKAAREVTAKYINSKKPLPFNIENEIEDKALKEQEKIANAGELRLQKSIVRESGVPIKNLPDARTYKGRGVADVDKDIVYHVENGKWKKRKLKPEDLG